MWPPIASKADCCSEVNRIVVLMVPCQHLHVLLLMFTDRDMDNGHTALMFAALEGDEIIVDVLLACVSVYMCAYVCLHGGYLSLPT